MLNITKTTQNYAKARNLSIDIDFCDEFKKDFIWISIDNDSCEPMFSMFANEDGSFTYRGNIWLSSATREEIPAHIADEKQLRQVLAYIAQDMRQEIRDCLQ